MITGFNPPDFEDPPEDEDENTGDEGEGMPEDPMPCSCSACGGL